MSNPQLLSGARGIIFQGQTALAVATDISVNVRQSVRPTFVVGDMNAVAIDSLAYDVDVSVGRVIPVNTAQANASSTSTPPVTGTNGPNAGSFEGQTTATAISAIGLGLEQVIATMVSASDIVIALQDRVTGAFIASVQGCRFSGRTQSMNANDIANERLTFVGIYDAGYQPANGTGDNTASALGYGLG